MCFYKNTILSFCIRVSFTGIIPPIFSVYFFLSDVYNICNILRNYSVTTVPRGVLARNCEGTEQLRIYL